MNIHQIGIMKIIILGEISISWSNSRYLLYLSKFHVHMCAKRDGEMVRVKEEIKGWVGK